MITKIKSFFTNLLKQEAAPIPHVRSSRTQEAPLDPFDREFEALLLEDFRQKAVFCNTTKCTIYRRGEITITCGYSKSNIVGILTSREFVDALYEIHGEKRDAAYAEERKRTRQLCDELKAILKAEQNATHS